MRALLRRCHLRMEAQDNLALLELVREHLARDHLFMPPTDTQLKERIIGAHSRGKRPA